MFRVLDRLERLVCDENFAGGILLRDGWLRGTEVSRRSLSLTSLVGDGHKKQSFFIGCPYL